MSNELPIYAVLDELLQQLAQHSRVLLQAPPGAGKTTALPLALLQQPWLAGRKILLLEPRRLAAKAAAARLAASLGQAVGQQVGYRVRFDSCVGAHTQLEVLTEGLFLRRLQADPELSDVGLVIFDEFHERSLDADLALALCLDAQAGLREDLRLLLMSATLNTEQLAERLAAPLVCSAGRQYPLQIDYCPARAQEPVLEALLRALLHSLAHDQGDWLVFLPGAGEIQRLQQRLSVSAPQVQVYPLYGDLPYEQQQAALQPDPQGRPKVVLASPIAESSLTINGVRVVLDSGLARVPRFDPRSGLTRLQTQMISQQRADQRAGRAARLGPGRCYRVWSASQRLLNQQPAEMLEADLAGLTLELAQWGAAPEALTWLDVPPSAALAQARTLLQALEALDAQQRLTATGRRMAELPLHPRLAHLLLQGQALGWGGLACDLAALLEERDPLKREAGVDIELRWQALQALRREGRAGAARWAADVAVLQRCEQAARQYRRLLKCEAPSSCSSSALAVLLALAYPERIAQQRPQDAQRYRLANGRGVRLQADDPLVGQRYLVAAQVDAGSEEGRIFLAAACDVASLQQYLPQQLRTEQRVYWDERQQAVLAVEEQLLGELLLSSRPLARPAAEHVTAALLQGMAQLGIASLPWTPALRQWQARVESVRQWCPELNWPTVHDQWLMEHLAHWLAPYLNGLTRREHLQRLDLGAILQSLLAWPLPQQLEQLAPTHLSVPSGSRIALEYFPDARPPVLAVKLQELFGLGDTPTVANGRMAVLLHLLSPAQRPIQVTQDLRGFWQRTYAEVKKELKGRYPKHPWPDDPWTAVPTRRAKPRGT